MIKNIFNLRGRGVVSKVHVLLDLDSFANCDLTVSVQHLSGHTLLRSARPDTTYEFYTGNACIDTAGVSTHNDCHNGGGY